jgi:hypothetical protein
MSFATAIGLATAHYRPGSAGLRRHNETKFQPARNRPNRENQFMDENRLEGSVRNVGGKGLLRMLVGA